MASSQAQLALEALANAIPTKSIGANPVMATTISVHDDGVPMSGHQNSTRRFTVTLFVKTETPDLVDNDGITTMQEIVIRRDGLITMNSLRPLCGIVVGVSNVVDNDSHALTSHISNGGIQTSVYDVDGATVGGYLPGSAFPISGMKAIVFCPVELGATKLNGAVTTIYNFDTGPLILAEWDSSYRPVYTVKVANSNDMYIIIESKGRPKITSMTPADKHPDLFTFVIRVFVRNANGLMELMKSGDVPMDADLAAVTALKQNNAVSTVCLLSRAGTSFVVYIRHDGSRSKDWTIGLQQNTTPITCFGSPACPGEILALNSCREYLIMAGCDRNNTKPPSLMLINRATDDSICIPFAKVIIQLRQFITI